jgi:hypothetical protein
VSADIEVITLVWSEFRDLGPLEDHVVDTVTQPVDAVAQTISDLMERRLLLP